MGLVPLSEGGSVNVDDAALHKSLGSEQLVVGGVVSLRSAAILNVTVHLPVPNNFDASHIILL